MPVYLLSAILGVVIALIATYVVFQLQRPHIVVSIAEIIKADFKEEYKQLTEEIGVLKHRCDELEKQIKSQNEEIEDLKRQLVHA